MSQGGTRPEIAALLDESRRFAPSAAWRAHAIVNDPDVYARAAADPESFWAGFAAELEWMRPWERVMRFEPPRHAWFEGGQLNACVNCVDRHVHGDRRNKAALLWVGEDGEEQAYTYGRLYREVNRFGNALRRLGVGKGDRVIIYMPLVPEGIVTMLACARIGAVHSVVFAGMGTEALRSRLVDSGAKAIVCSDYTWRRGRQIALKPTVDEAVRDLATV